MRSAFQMDMVLFCMDAMNLVRILTVNPRTFRYAFQFSKVSNAKQHDTEPQLYRSWMIQWWPFKRCSTN